jgi:hypothetical protein
MNQQGTITAAIPTNIRSGMMAIMATTIFWIISGLG